MRRRLNHYGVVFKNAAVFAGWVAGLVTVVFGGSVVAGGVFLLHYHHHALAVGLFAAGAIVAVLEGSYRVWDRADKELQVTRGRLRELDTPEAKRAYIDEEISNARQIQDYIGSLSDEEYGARFRTIAADTSHWEDGVRAQLRKCFELGTDAVFDSDEGLLTAEDLQQSVLGAGSQIAYLRRRIERLEQILQAL
jgi:hypothetical protein